MPKVRMDGVAKQFSADGSYWPTAPIGMPTLKADCLHLRKFVNDRYRLHVADAAPCHKRLSGMLPNGMIRVKTVLRLFGISLHSAEVGGQSAITTTDFRPSWCSYSGGLDGLHIDSSLAGS